MMVVAALSSDVLYARLLDVDGSATTLHEYAAGGVLVAYFMRTFTCPPCRGQVRRLIVGYPDLRALGAAVAVVGPGGPADARRLAAELAVPCAVLADPSLQSYVSAGLDRWLGAVQRSGTFGFLADGREVFAHRTLAPMRKPDLDALIDRLRRHTGSLAA